MEPGLSAAASNPRFEGAHSSKMETRFELETHELSTEPCSSDNVLGNGFAAFWRWPATRLEYIDDRADDRVKDAAGRRRERAPPACEPEMRVRE